MPIRIRELSDPACVEQTLDEFDARGRDDFLGHYGFRKAKTYYIERAGRRYDSKAIAGVAYGKQFGDRPTPRPSDFTGGEQSVARALRALGYRVVEVAPPATQVSAAAIDKALDEWDTVGRDEFLRRHALSGSQRYFIQRGGNTYDAKAVVAVAWSNEHPDELPLDSGDFSGNRATIHVPLERLGLTVVDSTEGEHEWDLQPGELIRRRDLHDRFGGRRQGGIGPSSTSPNVLIFSDPESGEQHGYFDAWHGDEFHYAGEGQKGDQELVQGNGAVLHHAEDGRAVRVFWGSKGKVEYAGEFELDQADPYYWVDAPESGSAATRKVVMFRLRPRGASEVADDDRPARRLVRPLLATPYRDVDPSTGEAPRDPFEFDPAAIERGLRGHKATQQDLAELVFSRGHEVLSPGPGDPNFDLAWRNHGGVTVVEVKSLTGTNEAGQIRLALGQVLDYQNQLEAGGLVARPVIALEGQPADPRWRSLCERHGVTLVWPAIFDALFVWT
jgi:hypothetical protein